VVPLVLLNEVREVTDPDVHHAGQPVQCLSRVRAAGVDARDQLATINPVGALEGTVDRALGVDAHAHLPRVGNTWRWSGVYEVGLSVSWRKPAWGDTDARRGGACSIRDLDQATRMAARRGIDREGTSCLQTLTSVSPYGLDLSPSKTDAPKTQPAETSSAPRTPLHAGDFFHAQALPPSRGFRRPMAIPIARILTTLNRVPTRK
jgi:hypothetical protein